MKSVMKCCVVVALSMNLGLLAKDSQEFLNQQAVLISQFTDTFADMDFNRGKLLGSISNKSEANFKQVLDAAKKFIGTDDAERKRNFKTVEDTFILGINKLQRAYKSIEMQNKNLFSQKRSDPKSKGASPVVEKNDLGSLKIDQALLQASFDSVLNKRDDIEVIRDSAKINAGMQKGWSSKCTGQTCKERFKLVYLYAEHLILILDRMQKLLDILNASKA